ncbi:MAG: hypothetical protein JST92_08860, partial [Deltaproteobacteria bacterium]|nr:hypothetical protein [Deltaproteobacteria bacterium]
LRFAIATKANPTSRADWTIVGDVVSADRPPIPCGGACASDQVCIVDANAPNSERCAKPAATCVPACTGKQTCVGAVDSSKPNECHDSKQADANPDLPPGTGLMPALKFMDDKAVIAYYDSLTHSLKAVKATAAGAAPAFGAAVELDGNDATTSTRRDAGRWPSIDIAPSTASQRIAITFQDLTSQQLLLYTSNDLFAHPAHAADGASGLIHVLDNGLPASGDPWHAQSFPGVQSAVAFTPAGKIAAAYQDGTPVDLLFATFDPSTNKVGGRATVRSDGATGFYPRVVMDQGTAYISSATIKAATAQLTSNALKLDSRSAP